MYAVYLTNFDYFLGYGQNYPTFETAVQAGKKAGFEFTLYHGSKILGFWSPIGGWHDYLTI